MNKVPEIDIVKLRAELGIVPIVQPTTDYVIVYTETLSDGKRYQLMINQNDHKWYKSPEICRYQEDYRRNTVWKSKYGDPVLLTKKDRDYLDNKTSK